MKSLWAVMGFLALWAVFTIVGFAVPLFVGTEDSALGYSMASVAFGVLFGPLVAIMIFRPRQTDSA